MPVTIHGLDELLASMEALPYSMQKNIIVRALRKGAEPIRERAEELAPFLTGTLKESMMITVSDQTADGATAKIGPSRKGFYGQFEEFGTARQRAEPFLRPAFDEKVKEAMQLAGEELASQIERSFRRR